MSLFNTPFTSLPTGTIFDVFGTAVPSLVIDTIAPQNMGANTAPVFNTTVIGPSAADVFNIELNYTGAAQFQYAFDEAIAIWEGIITTDLPDYLDTNSVLVDDLRIDAVIEAIDGVGNILGSAGPTALRQAIHNFLPVTGLMRFDSADIAALDANGTLTDVVLHEMGHVLGLGTFWDGLGLIGPDGSATQYQYNGANALREYRTLTGNPGETFVPVADEGAAGTRRGHWDEDDFNHELMTGFIEGAGTFMPISRMSVGALDDLGYTVDYGNADPYALPGNAASDDLSASIRSTGSVVVNGAAATGTIEVSGDKDWFGFAVVAGQHYTITTAANGAAATPLQTSQIGGIYDSVGNLILGTASDGNTDNTITFTASANGMVYAEISDAAAATGGYVVQVATAAQGPGIGVLSDEISALESQAVLIDGDVAVSDAELDALNGGNGDYNGASLTIARDGSSNADDVFAFALTAATAITVNGGNLQLGGNTFATFTLTAGTFEISFTNANGTTPTTALVNEVIQAVTYENTGSNLVLAQVATFDLNWSFSDGMDALTDQITVELTGIDDDETFDGVALVGAIDGGLGSNTVTYAASAAGVTTSLASTTMTITGDANGDIYTNIQNLTGTTFNDVLVGDAGSNRLDGGTGFDVLIAKEGADILVGGSGAANALYGGAGDDIYIVSANDTIIENAGEGTDTVQTGLGVQILRANVENLTYTGTGAFVGIGNSEANVIQGTTGSDQLVGFDGADTLIGGTGAANTLIGGTGDDTYVVSANDTIVENAAEGTDTVQTDRDVHILRANVENLTYTGAGAFVGIGNVEANVIQGSTGGDVLAGFGGADTLIGGAGAANTLIGGTGDDIYVVTANDTIVENLGEGTDTVQTTRTNYTLRDNVENLAYTGTGAFTGTGNAAANQLQGGTGNDILTGLLGTDTFVFAEDWGDDTVTDFEDGVEMVDMSGAGVSAGDINITTSGTDAIIDFGGPDSITFTGLAGLIDINDFDFV